jgi:hypothetical protein
MKRPKLYGTSRKKGIRTSGCYEAWFYENAKSIDVYLCQETGGSLYCRIPRALLADWIERTK